MVRLSKYLLLICSVLFLFASSVLAAAGDETITITSYYPSPYGSYNTLTSNDFTSTTGKITTLNSTTGTIDTLNSTTGTVTNLNSTTGRITNLNSTTGTVTNLNSTTGVIATGTVTNLNSTTGTITNLNSSTGTIGALTSATGTIDKLALGADNSQPNRSGDLQLKVQSGAPDSNAWRNIVRPAGQVAYSSDKNSGGLYYSNGTAWVAAGGGGGCYLDYTGACQTTGTQFTFMGFVSNGATMIPAGFCTRGNPEVATFTPSGSCPTGWTFNASGRQNVAVCCKT